MKRGRSQVSKEEIPSFEETIDKHNFDFDRDYETINEIPTLLLIYSDHCGHCIRFKPTFAEIYNHYKYHTKKRIRSVRYQECEEFCISHKINTVPTILFFAKGDKPGMYQGDRSVEHITNRFEAYCLNAYTQWEKQKQ